jgi:SAM-dependent methyltransferase
MEQRAAKTDWDAARGDKWAAQLAGMEAMLEPIDAALIDALRLDAPLAIAEVGSGGGGTTLALLRRAPVGSRVHGFDISPKLIELAQARAAQHEAAIRFTLADMATAAPDQPYQRLVSRFGVMFFADAGAAFRNLARWLAPDGRFAFAVWGPVSENPWLTYARDAVAQVVEMPPVDPDAPGAYRYADVNKLLALLGAAGFRDLEVQDWRGTLPVGGASSVQQATAFALSAFSSFGELLAKAGEVAHARAHQLLQARYAQHVTDGAVRMAARVHIVTGSRR